MDGLKEIFEKISSYNIFNYLLPGILFPIICKLGIGINLVLDNNFLGVFLYYFIGMVISRIGSVIVEPILKRVNFLKFSDYKKFIQACRIDAKIELLSEVNNTYRTLLSMLLLLLILKLYKYYNSIYWHFSRKDSFIVALVFLIILFLFSYRKQTDYIRKRVENNLTP
jgi:hypothetical protein